MTREQLQYVLSDLRAGMSAAEKCAVDAEYGPSRWFLNCADRADAAERHRASVAARRAAIAILERHVKEQTP